MSCCSSSARSPLCVLAYRRASGAAWAATVGAWLALSWVVGLPSFVADAVLTFVVVVLALPLLVPRLRRALISDALLRVFRKVMPAMSQTEREAIEAGTVWWDGDLFSVPPTGRSSCRFRRRR